MTKRKAKGQNEDVQGEVREIPSGRWTLAGFQTEEGGRELRSVEASRS